MSTETAELVHYAILGAGGLIWLVALVFHRTSFRSPDPLEPTVLGEGEADVAAAPSDVRDRFVESLRSGAGNGTGAFLIEEAGDRTIRGVATVFSRGQNRGSLRFHVNLSDGGSGTRATWRLSKLTPVGGLQWASRVFVYVLSPAALATAAYLVQTNVLPSPDPQVREQAVQTIQIVHVLWPAFLFGGLHRRVVRVLGGMMENALRNAAF